MALQRRIGLGVTIGVDTTLNSTNYAVLGNVVNTIKHSGTKADEADISILSDTWKQFGKGQIDPGSYTFEVACDPNDTNTSSKLSTLHAATGVNYYNWQIILPAVVAPGTNAIGYCNFTAHLTSLGLSIEKDKLIVTPVTIKVTGNPNL